MKKILLALELATRILEMVKQAQLEKRDLTTEELRILQAENDLLEMEILNGDT